MWQTGLRARGIDAASRPEPLFDQAAKPWTIDEVESVAFVGKHVQCLMTRVLDDGLRLRARERLPAQRQDGQVDQQPQLAHAAFLFGERRGIRALRVGR